MTIARRTRAAIDAAKSDVTLVGPAAAFVTRSFTGEVLKEGVTKYFNVFSFHELRHRQVEEALHEMPRWKNLPNRRGQPIESWMTRDPIPAPTCTVGSKRPARSSTIRSRSRGTRRHHLHARRLKASGIKKAFHYHADAHPAGRIVYRNEWMSMIDINGIPFSPLPAHAAAVYLLEDAAPVGFEKIAVGDATVSVCRFSAAVASWPSSGPANPSSWATPREDRHGEAGGL